jgi:hypothetical protein
MIKKKSNFFTKEKVDKITILNDSKSKLFDKVDISLLYLYDLKPEYQLKEMNKFRQIKNDQQGIKQELKTYLILENVNKHISACVDIIESESQVYIEKIKNLLSESENEKEMKQ